MAATVHAALCVSGVPDTPLEIEGITPSFVMPGSSRHPPWYLTNGRWKGGTVDAGTGPA